MVSQEKTSLVTGKTIRMGLEISMEIFGLNLTTLKNQMILRVDLEAPDGRTAVAEYTTFR